MMFPDPKQFTWTATNSGVTETVTAYGTPEPTLAGVTVYVPPVEKLCRNCRFWESAGGKYGLCLNGDVLEFCISVDGERFFSPPENFHCAFFDQRD